MNGKRWLVVMIVLLLAVSAVQVVGAQDVPPLPLEVAELPDFAAHWQTLVVFATVIYYVVEQIKPGIKAKFGSDNRIIQLIALLLAVAVSLAASVLFKAYPFGEGIQSHLLAAVVATVLSMMGYSGGKAMTGKPNTPSEVVRG